VFITDRGRPAHVLLTIDDYRKLAGNSYAEQTLADLLALPGAEDIEFEASRLSGELTRDVDLS
jgi:hypothetical protein